MRFVVDIITLAGLLGICYKTDRLQLKYWMILHYLDIKCLFKPEIARKIRSKFGTLKTSDIKVKVESRLETTCVDTCNGFISKIVFSMNF